jgi:hypothetical protein
VTIPIGQGIANSLSRRTRFLLFLYGSRNIAGCALALAGLGLYFVGIIDRFWLLIVAGLYGIGYLAAPGSRSLDLSLGQALDTDAIDEALDRLLRHSKKALEADVFVLVTSIVESIRAMLPRLAHGAGVGDRTLFDVRQTALDYLPATLERYSGLPNGFRRLHTLADGRTAHDLLKEQLVLLDSKMKEVVTSVHEGDTDALAANGRFLQERFGADAFQLEPVNQRLKA